jgi:hypothetical protein
MGFDDLVLLSAAGLTDGTVDLSEVDVLYLGGALTFTSAQTVGADEVRELLRGGKGMVGRGAGATAFGNAFGLLTATAVAGNVEGTGIVDVDTPEGSLLEPVAQPYGFVAPATWFTNLGVNTEVEARYGEGNPLVAGHWDDTDFSGNPALDATAAGGKASVISGSTRRGSNAMVFGTLPTYRTYTRGAYSQLGHGLLWAAGGVEGVQPPTDPEPEPEPTTPDLGMTLERNPITVGQKPRALVELDLGDAAPTELTLQIRKAGEVIATRTVRRDGSFVVGLPKQPAGKHRIRAVVLPSETTTRANSPLRILRVTRS